MPSKSVSKHATENVRSQHYGGTVGGGGGGNEGTGAQRSTGKLQRAILSVVDKVTVPRPATPGGMDNGGGGDGHRGLRGLQGHTPQPFA